MGRESRRLRVLVSGAGALPPSARKPAVLRRAAEAALDSNAKGRRLEGEVNVVFLTRAEMLRMNRHYLGHDYDTDVISFEHEAVEGLDDESPIGDVFVSAWMVRRQAAELGHSALREAATLVAHGCLHLVGHDDHAPAKKKAMFKVQDAVVASLGLR